MSDAQPLPPILKNKEGNGVKKTTPEEDNTGEKNKRVSFHVSVREHSRLLPKPLESGANALAELTEGALLIKLRNKKTYERYYYYDPQVEGMCWFSKKNKGNVKSISIRSILSVRPGKNGPVFQSMDTSEFAEWTCFTVTHKDGVLDLVAPDEDTRDKWVIGLRFALKKAHNRMAPVRQRRRDHVKAIFASHDARGCGKLTLGQTQAAFLELLPYMQPYFLRRKIQYLQERFAAADSDAVVPFDVLHTEFQALATRREMFRLFQMYSTDTEALSSQDLHILLEAEQQALGVNPAKCKELVQQYEAIPYNRSNNALGLDGLTALLRGEYVLSAKTSATRNDMSRPLSYYFINSSHNTYLDGNQLKSNCTPDAIASALTLGARLIEVDIWPGSEAGSEEEAMVVFHGHTKTPSCSVKDALDSISANAFTASEFPLIVLLEMHLESEDAQRTLAAQIKESLGPALLPATDPLIAAHEHALPSPQQLKRRIVLCSQRAPFEAIAEGATAHAIPYDEYGFYVDVKKNKKKKKGGSGTTKNTPVTLATAWSEVVALNHEAVGRDIAAALATPDPWTLRSMSESDVIKAHDAGELEDVLRLTHQQLVRVHPGPPRVDSTNFIPTAFWSVGIQCCCLNFQTHDHGLQINTARFALGNNTGYARKPPFLVDEAAPYTPTPDLHDEESIANAFPSSPRLFSVTILSAQQLRHPEAEYDIHQVIDPYVHVQLLGVTADEASYTTRALDNCDFNAYWNERCAFPVLCPPLAMVQFLVLDDDIVHENFLGQAVVPFSLMSTGHWHVQLCDKLGSSIPGAMLFIKLEVTDLESDSAPGAALQHDHVQHQPKPRLSDTHTQLRRISLNEAVRSDATALSLSGNEELDTLFKACNALIERFASLQTQAEAARRSLLAAVDRESATHLNDAVGALANMLADKQYSVQEEGQGIAVVLDNPSSAAPATKTSLQALRDLSKAYSEFLSQSEELSQLVLEKETLLEQQEEELRDKASSSVLSLVRNNCAIFRSIPTKITTLATLVQDELFSLKNAFMRKHRTSLAPFADFTM